MRGIDGYKRTIAIRDRNQDHRGQKDGHPSRGRRGNEEKCCREGDGSHDGQNPICMLEEGKDRLEDGWNSVQDGWSLFQDVWSLDQDGRNGLGQEEQRHQQQGQEDHRAAICVESERSVGCEEDFGRHRREVVVVDKMEKEIDEVEKEISERYVNIVDEVGERENEERPGCEKTAAEEIANLVEDLGI